MVVICATTRGVSLLPCPVYLSLFKSLSSPHSWEMEGGICVQHLEVSIKNVTIWWVWAGSQHWMLSWQEHGECWMWRTWCWRRSWMGQEVLQMKFWGKTHEWQCKWLLVILGILGSLEMLLCCHFAPKMHAITAKNSASVPAKMKGKRSTYSLISSLSMDCCLSIPWIHPMQCQRSICWCSCSTPTPQPPCLPWLGWVPPTRWGSTCRCCWPCCHLNPSPFIQICTRESA